MPCLASIFLHQLIPLSALSSNVQDINTLKLPYVNPPLSTLPHLLVSTTSTTSLGLPLSPSFLKTVIQSLWITSFLHHPMTFCNLVFLFIPFHWSYCLSIFLIDNPPPPLPQPCSILDLGCCLFIIWCVDNLLATLFGFRNTTLLAIFLPLPLNCSLIVCFSIHSA